MASAEPLALCRAEVMYGRHVLVPAKAERVPGQIRIDLMALLRVEVVGGLEQSGTERDRMLVRLAIFMRLSLHELAHGPLQAIPDGLVPDCQAGLGVARRHSMSGHEHHRA